jgi:hypothetical protein
VKNTQQWCENNLINNINLMIHYNHIEILSKEICDGRFIVVATHLVIYLHSNQLHSLFDYLCCNHVQLYLYKYPTLGEDAKVKEERIKIQASWLLIRGLRMKDIR